MSNHLQGTITLGPGPTPDERRAASRLVLRHARNREDLRLLLDALGLTQQPTAPTTRPRRTPAQRRPA